MTRKDLRKRLDATLGLKSIQGLIAFAVGTASYFLIAITFYQYDVVGRFIFTNLSYTKAATPWSGGAVAWAYVSSFITTLIMMAIMVTLVTVIMISVFRWLGLSAKWSVIQRVFIWSILANALVFALNYIEPYLLDERRGGIPLQTLVGYTQLILLGLPYTFAWLWATRGQKALDLRARKR